jgi:hypothetical protein
VQQDRPCRGEKQLVAMNELLDAIKVAGWTGDDRLVMQMALDVSC